MSFNGFQQGQRCPVCYKKNFEPHNKLSYTDVKIIIETDGNQLISQEYINSQEKLEILCPNGHIYKMSHACFRNGHRCPVCAAKKRGKNKRNEYENIKSYIEYYDCQLLSRKYKNSHEKLEILCPNGHVFEMKYNSFQQGRRCPICAKYFASSKAEKEIQQFCRSIYNGKINPHDRDTVINPLTGCRLELDIYLPEINKAIEFNGNYWHSNIYQQYKDKIKKEQCEKSNIELLIIDESN